MAPTGHSATQIEQSMHSSGCMTRKFGLAKKQSMGQTATQSVYLHWMHASVTTKVMIGKPGAQGRMLRLQHARFPGRLRAGDKRGVVRVFQDAAYAVLPIVGERMFQFFGGVVGQDLP